MTVRRQNRPLLPSHSIRNTKLPFIAGFGPIVREASISRRLYNQNLCIGFEEEDGGYLRSEALKSTKTSALWALSQNRVAMLWQGFQARRSFLR
jgi:hypothetical protein